MNSYDSQLMTSILEKEGYHRAQSIDQADIIIINTCSVREHAVNRAISRVESLKPLKKKNPQIRIGITGCIPQQMKNSLLEKLPFIDFILGPDNFQEIASCAKDTNGIFTDFKESLIYSKYAPPARGNFPEAFVAVMRGCNNFCSYCVVPYTRGKEKSRSIDDICHEVNILSKKGYKRVILLGQNVNNFNDTGKRLPYLLSKIVRIKGIERIGFLTSHPAYFPLETIDIMKDEPKIEKFLHLPLQSGSSKILKLMKRNYTKSSYISIIEKVRNKIDDIFLSTDIIVGFPGESEDDFSETIEIIKKISFDSAYMFIYSPRRFTLANSFNDFIGKEVKNQRLRELIRVQSEITKKKSKAYKGKILDILITGKNKKNYLESIGISVYNKIVVVKEQINKGEIVKVSINDVKGWTPIGEIFSRKGGHKKKESPKL